MLLDHVGRDEPSDLADWAEQTGMVHVGVRVVDEVDDVRRVTRWPYLERGADVAGVDRSPLRVLVDLHDLDVVAKFALEQLGSYFDVQRRTVPRIGSECDLGLRTEVVASARGGKQRERGEQCQEQWPSALPSLTAAE